MTMNTRTLLLIGLTLLAVALALFLPAIPKTIAYHDFANKRTAYGIENFLDVTSNVAFALARGAGLLLVLRPRTSFASRPNTGPTWSSASACAHRRRLVLLHLEPNNETLFWDRLPMTIAFMSLISAQIVDRIDVRTGLLALVPMLLIGIGTVVYWIVTERQGRGNVMPYVVLQAYVVIVLLKLTAMHPSRYTHGNAIYAVFAGYLLAKVFEHYDRQIFELTGVVSGHTLKHVVAGLAGVPVAYMLWRRRLAGPATVATTEAPASTRLAA